MILYKSDAKEFVHHVSKNEITDIIDNQFREKIGYSASPNEKYSWANSMQYMKNIITDSQIPHDCGILVEYNIPSTSKRIDFIIAGHDEQDNANFIIVELKQWMEAQATNKESLVKTFLGGGIRETTHPCYQANSYLRYLSDMNEAIHTGGIKAISCAYLHNYNKHNPEPLLSSQYNKIVEQTPIFFSKDVDKLEDFVRRYVGKGNGIGILYNIENGRIVPSKKLIDFVSDMYSGNPVYTLLDEQKVAYSNIIQAATSAKKKTVIIVNGGPGTGKSVVAISALVELLKKKYNIRFIAPNQSYRDAMVDTLARHKKDKKRNLTVLFTGSACYYNANLNEFDVLICDEAHRLKNGTAYQYKGESQVDDVIKAGKVCVFFIDDNQMIRPQDEGSVAKLKEVAKQYDADIVEIELVAQFRCSGADGYLNWVDSALQIRETGNFNGWEGDFEFKVFDDPNKLYKAICDKNDKGFKARLLAGYAWPWTSDKDGNLDGEVNDIEIPEYNFEMPWNSRKLGMSWATEEIGRNQIGCVHTSQGLEFDYVGVIMGNDIQIDPATNRIFGSYKDYYDKPGKSNLKNDPETFSTFIKRIYKVLMSRGMKGCYVYCCDKNLEHYLKQRCKSITN